MSDELKGLVEIIQEDARKEGIEKGIEKGQKDLLLNAIASHSVEEVSRVLDISVGEINKLLGK